MTETLFHRSLQRPRSARAAAVALLVLALAGAAPGAQRSGDEQSEKKAGKKAAEGKGKEGKRPKAADAPTTAPSRPAAAQRPRLAVLIVVDALGYDYLVRHESLLAPRGFRRLLDGGASFSNARYPYASTRTGPGHASIATGATPALHGIVANKWFDHAIGKRVEVDEDGAYRIVGRPAGAPDQPGLSPAMIMGSTIADELREVTSGRARVVSVSVKPRSAIMLGGHRPNGVYWFDEETGRVVTSSYYATDVPVWVKALNGRVSAAAWFGKSWERLLPAASYERFGADDQPGEQPVHGGRTFPHKITGGQAAPGPDFYEAVTVGPFGNDLTLELALGALEGEQLGADDVPDLLSISFSGTDNVGHEFGPNSHEVLDLFVRLDRHLETLFDALDRRLGEAYSVVLTSDHGLMPLVEVSQAAGHKAARINPDAVVAAIEARLDKDLGVGDWVVFFEDESVYLNRALAAQKGVDYSKLCRLAGEAAVGVEGIDTYVTAGDLMTAASSKDARVVATVAGHHAKRSGDVTLVIAPFYILRDEPDGTAHGSPYSYDNQVPIIAYRCGVRPGVWHRPVSPLDIAPTLATVLGTGLPSNCQGATLGGDEP